MHLTLKFIGESPCPVRDIEDAPIGLLKDHVPFELGVKEVGAFPNWKRPYVLWLGLESSGKLRKLAMDLDISLNQKCGIQRERRDFRAHITVGRVKENVDPLALKVSMERCLEKLIKSEYSTPIRKIHLMNSNLTPDGPIYKVIKEYELAQE